MAVEPSVHISVPECSPDFSPCRQGIKKSEAAKKQRELKKFGKQIQHEKLKQREQDKKSFQDRVQGIKRSEWGLGFFLHTRSSAESICALQKERRAWILARTMASSISRWKTLWRTDQSVGSAVDEADAVGQTRAR